MHCRLCPTEAQALSAPLDRVLGAAETAAVADTAADAGECWAAARRARQSLAADGSLAAAAAADVAVDAADDGTVQVAVAMASWDVFVSARAAQRHAGIVDYTSGTAVAAAVVADAAAVADRPRAIDRTCPHLGIRAHSKPAVRGPTIRVACAASASAPWQAAENDEDDAAAAAAVEKDEAEEAENGEQEEATEQVARVMDNRWQFQGTAEDAIAEEHHAMAD